MVSTLALVLMCVFVCFLCVRACVRARARVCVCLCVFVVVFTTSQGRQTVFKSCSPNKISYQGEVSGRVRESGRGMGGGGGERERDREREKQREREHIILCFILYPIIDFDVTRFINTRCTVLIMKPRSACNRC